MPKGKFRTRGVRDEDKPNKWSARGGMIMTDRKPRRCFFRVNGCRCNRIVPPEGTHFRDLYACTEHSRALEAMAWDEVDTELRREEAATWGPGASAPQAQAVPA